MRSKQVLNCILRICFYSVWFIAYCALFIALCLLRIDY